MTVIDNPQKYDCKIPTNIRIEAKLKQLAIEESKKYNITLARIVNEALTERYKLNITMKGE